jgi:hypothetical protein
LVDDHPGDLPEEVGDHSKSLGGGTNETAAAEDETMRISKERTIAGFGHKNQPLGERSLEEPAIAC